ncbi:MAG: hypothetical protein FIB01_15820 [Gemmatimonadetes bacterium]|nr:hypothetical protein [Gemmatimonadota bacterium]
MFRKVDDFVREWQYEMDATLRLFRALTDESLEQRVAPEGRSVGRLAWHLTQSLPEMMNRTGLQVHGPAEAEPVPASAPAIASAYELAAGSMLEQIRTQWQDDTLLELREMYGEQWPNGVTLAALVKHQAHHRGQMTVLMRQAGLKVPGVYGPAREEWAQWHMPAPE